MSSRHASYISTFTHLIDGTATCNSPPCYFTCKLYQLSAWTLSLYLIIDYTHTCRLSVSHLPSSHSIGYSPASPCLCHCQHCLRGATLWDKMESYPDAFCGKFNKEGKCNSSKVTTNGGETTVQCEWDEENGVCHPRTALPLKNPVTYISQPFHISLTTHQSKRSQSWSEWHLKSQEGRPL
jgi:hypothetical protein